MSISTSLAFGAAVEVAFARLRDEWDETDGKLTFEGEDFDSSNIDGSWIRASVQHQVSRLAAIGQSKTQRRYAQLSVQLFVPRDGGVAEGYRLAAIVKGLFEQQTIGGVRFRETTPIELGVDGKWWQVNAVTSFDYDEVV